MKNLLHVHVHERRTAPLHSSHFLHNCTYVTCTCNMCNHGVMRSDIYHTKIPCNYSRGICNNIKGLPSGFRVMGNWSSCQNVCMRCYNTQFDIIMTSYVLISDKFPCQSLLGRIILICNNLIPIEVWLNLIGYDLLQM